MATRRTGISMHIAGTLALVVGCGAASLLAQSSAPPPAKCKTGSKDPACTKTASDPANTSAPSSSANDNPFPVEDSQHGGNAAPDASGKSTAAPSSPTSDNPFPVEDSKHGSNGAPSNGNFPDMPTNGVPDPPASSEKPMKLPPSGYSTSGGDDDPGTSSSSSKRSEDDDIAPTAAAPNAPVKASPLKDLGSHGDTSLARAKLEQTRIQDDLKVGSFYMKDGNAQGAYLRFKDALDRAPDDPDVRYSLAEAASKLNKRDEAILNYRECLKLDPAGDHDKASRKALQRLGAAAQ